MLTQPFVVSPIPRRAPDLPEADKTCYATQLERIRDVFEEPVYSEEDTAPVERVVELMVIEEVGFVVSLPPPPFLAFVLDLFSVL